MKTKKTVIVMLAAVLLISAALIVGCMNPLDGTSEQKDTDEDNYQIPVGKGVIRLKISDTNARTVFPNPTSFPLASMVFDVDFTSATGTNANDLQFVEKKPISAATAPAVLTAGDSYHISIRAFKNETNSGDGDFVQIAQWDNKLTTGLDAPDDISTGVAVSTSSVDVTANLIGFTDDGTNGFFTYHVTINPFVTQPTHSVLAYTSQKLEVLDSAKASLVSPISQNLTVFGAPGNTQTPPTGIVLPAGYYWVKVTLEADNCQPRIVQEAIHIYPLMTTEYGTAGSTRTIALPNQDTFIVQFDANSTNVTLDTFPGATGGILELSDIPNADNTAGDHFTDDQPTSSNDYTFVGWFQDESRTLEWLPTSRVFSDRTVYGKWLFDPPGGGQGVTLTIGFESTSPMTLTGGVVTSAGPASTTTYDRIVDGYDTDADSDPDFWDYLEYTVTGNVLTITSWEFDGADITHYATNSNKTLIIDKNVIEIFPHLFTTGMHYIIVSGTRSPGNQLYSESISLSITND